MGRYLIYFSYIGTKYSGSQRQPSHSIKNLPIVTIQGTLEKALQKLRSANEPKTHFASRTDKGVHALMNTLHVDLEHLKEGTEYQPDAVCSALNRYLRADEHDIRIFNVKKVADNFHSRHLAKKRTYLYRIAVNQKYCFREGSRTVNGSWNSQGSILPIVEEERCFGIGLPFCEMKMQQTAALFQGTHDFATFMSTANGVDPTTIDTVRTLHVVDIRPGTGFLENYDHRYDGLTFYNIIIESRSFLYKQVRRLVGAMVAVGQGRVRLDHIQDMLKNPSKDSWDPRITLAPPGGLYLKSIEYNEEGMTVCIHFHDNIHGDLTYYSYIIS